MTLPSLSRSWVTTLSRQRIMFGWRKRLYAAACARQHILSNACVGSMHVPSTSFSAALTLSLPRGQRIFFKAKRRPEAVSWAR